MLTVRQSVIGVLGLQPVVIVPYVVCGALIALLFSHRWTMAHLDTPAAAAAVLGAAYVLSLAMSCCMPVSIIYR